MIDLFELGEKHILPFDLNADETKLYKILNDYFNKKEGDLTVRCGIGLTGSVGVGKTVIFRLVQWSRKYNLAIIKTTDIERDYKLYENHYDFKEILLDDLGEENKANTYGKDEDVLGLFLSRRYELWLKKGILTHFTTNGSIDSLKNKYGDRLWDRVMEMCQPIPFPTLESKRQISKLIPPTNTFNEKPKQVTNEDREVCNTLFADSVLLKENDFKNSCEKTGVPYFEYISSMYNLFYRDLNFHSKEQIKEIKKLKFAVMIEKYKDKINDSEFLKFTKNLEKDNKYTLEWTKMCRVHAFEEILNNAIENEKLIVL